MVQKVMRAKKVAALFCQRCDHDIPELICGAPLPCSYHTVSIDLKPNPPTITIPATAAPQMNRGTLTVLKEIARGLRK